MATRPLLSEEQLLCSICLNVFHEPVSTPCGHNFCHVCLTQHWDTDAQCLCPLCGKAFSTRPELQVNALLSEIAAPFRTSGAPPAGQLCDLCTGAETGAVKSCPVCEASYCQAHWGPHETVPRLRRHLLCGPVVPDRACKKHGRPLEVFCQIDQACLCQLCSELDHLSHMVVPLIEERERRKAQLGEADIQHNIQARRAKIQQIRGSVKVSKDGADAETAAGVKVFTRLMQTIRESMQASASSIQEQHKSVEKQAEGFIGELEQEIVELSKRRSELQRLSHTEDHLQFLHNVPSLSTPVHTRNLVNIKIVQPSYRPTVDAALDGLVKTLGEEVKDRRPSLVIKAAFPLPSKNFL